MSVKVRNVVIALVLVASLALSFGAGCTIGAGATPSPDESLDVIEQAWDFIFSDYVELDRLNAETLSQAAIEAMVTAIDDPYTSFLAAEDYQLSMTSLEGGFGGIGAQVTVKDEQLTIIAPLPNSPALKAGIRAGDIILEIDGEPASGMSIAEAVLTIRGPKGTVVKLLVLHQGENLPQEIEIVRDDIELPSVSFEMRDEIAYIKIAHFSERTNQELSPVWQSMTEQGAAGIIIDLRRNPGGLLSSVVDVASNFLEEGIVVKVVDNQGKESVLNVKSGGAGIDLPIVMLTDNHSASGSEVLSGTLQDYGRATIAGTQTFGKGSVNALRRLKDGSGLYLTVARWLTPNGRLIEGEGLAPDYELELQGEEAIQWAVDFLRRTR